MEVAKRVARKGYKTLVLEEDRVIGSPVQCAGLVSPRVVDITGTASVLDGYSHATIHPPGTEPLEISSDETRAYILDRGAFDKEMASCAEEEGADISLGCRVTGWDLENTLEYRKFGKKLTCKGSIIVGADGPSSIMRRLSGVGGKVEYLPGIQALVGKEPDGIHIFIGNDIAPGFFAWELPHPSGTIIGLATDSDNAYAYLTRLLRSRGLDRKIIGLQAGTIPLGRLNRSVVGSLMLVGDAALQVKPLSGGGLYTGLLSAAHCSEVITDSLEKEDISENSLSEYHDRWQRDIGGEISRGLWMRRIYRNFSDKEFDKLFDALGDEKILKVIGDMGDIDYPSDLTRPILKTSPKLIKFAGPLIKNFF